MQSFICGKCIDKYVIASRFGNMGAVISKKRYDEMLELYETDSQIDTWTIDYLAKIGFKTESQEKLREIILVRNPSVFSFGKVSYEITETCNYRCEHCYLGQKRESNLSLDEKKKIIELIEKSGCLWLQITGGEPLLDKDFVEVYKFAHSLGLLITLSTNGSLLSDERISFVIKKYPPYRLTISSYGATANSYEALTKTRRSFDRFMEGIKWASNAKIRTRLNIIATKYNQNEISDMQRFAKDFGFECYVFSSLLPTIHGNAAPIDLMSQDCDSIKKRVGVIAKEVGYVSCSAGRNSFHVNSKGKMSICKTAREPNIDLLENGVSSLYELIRLSKEISDSPTLCTSCGSRNTCTTCPSILKLYLQGKKIPSFVCERYYTD